MKILQIICAIFLPPLAVFLKEGIGTQFWINLILTILVVSAPLAIIHAFWVILFKKPE